MKRNYCILLMLGVLVIQNAISQVTEDFNPRNGVAFAELKGYLHNRCWIISNFDINRIAGKEPNGMLVMSAPTGSNERTGIYTPVLNVQAQMNVSFTYRFNQAIEPGARRWLKVYLADANNMPVQQLDSVEFLHITPGLVYTYDKPFASLKPGAYKLFLNLRATNGVSRIAIDQLKVSAAMHYANGCNSSPVAVNDNISGLPDHIASGEVTANDKDPDQDALTAYLVNNSPDGTVALKPDGRFTFTPNPGFTGNSTSFTYRVCDNGTGKLCSPDARVTLRFPSEPISLNDFRGLYNDNGRVAISWATSFEQNSNRFELERSLDGAKWQTAGTVRAQGISTTKKLYAFTDEVGRNAALKKDLYYRLKQIDEEGKVALSRILVVRVYNTRSLKMVSVTPNPAKNDIAITAQLNETSFVAMKIFDASGAVVLNKALKADAGANSFIMEGSSNLEPGMYMLDVTVNSKERMKLKLIKE